MHRRLCALFVGLLALIGPRWASVPHLSGAVADLSAQQAPQATSADFNADGRPDLASLRDAPAGPVVRIELSGSTEVITLAVRAVSIISGDIDHDGDLDLAVATSSNQVVIWFNDGQGHFTRESPSAPTDGLVPLTTVAGVGSDELLFLGPKGPEALCPTRPYEIAVEPSRIRPATVQPVVALRFLTARSLRGPPLTIAIS
jgi:hypothetical protein